jgi:hypothetical protein
MLVWIICVSCLISFLHFCIGSPKGDQFSTGRIFSFWGRFVTERWLMVDEKLNMKIEGELKVIQEREIIILNQKLRNHQNNSKKIIEEFNKKILNEKKRLESNKGINLYSALGSCYICFGTWISILSWINLIIIENLDLYWLFLAIPTSVILSKYVKIEKPTY